MRSLVLDMAKAGGGRKHAGDCGLDLNALFVGCGNGTRVQWRSGFDQRRENGRPPRIPNRPLVVGNCVPLGHAPI
jgi:hypothetical protein